MEVNGTHSTFDRPFIHKNIIMPRTEEQLKEIRGEKRQLIMETALALFAKQGFHVVSINQIANEAGISKGLMYNYFKSKDELLERIINESFAEILHYFDPNHDGVLEQHELLQFIDKAFDTIHNDYNFWKLFYSLFVQPHVFELVSKQYTQVLEPFYKMLTEYFVKKGYKNPHAEAVFFAATLDGLAINYIVDPDHFPLEDIKEKVKSLYR